MKSGNTVQWLSGALLFCFVALGAFAWRLSERLRVLEVANAERQKLEPLKAPHCGEPTCPVSMFELISHPHRYDGQRLRLVGVYCGGCELSALFPTEAVGYLLREQSISVEPERDILGPSEDAASGIGGTTRCKEVMMFGVFKAGASGHAGKHFGELVDVTTDVAER